ncbi:hypothetical protein PanWU01x14_274340 [Parasponia andersonii]|uniref:RNase H type-1 domain-containing protein n=1 Tax=Parasponia andersonii TaxID=3476 RepID=A0A2P5B3S0_PARAD|nr:hypothetical protein PanWU01x14_274340 [Parasponia andersonii]
MKINKVKENHLIWLPHGWNSDENEVAHICEMIPYYKPKLVVWANRNYSFHTGKGENSRSLLIALETLVGEHLHNRDSAVKVKVNGDRKQPILNWTNTSSGKLGIFCDAAYKDGKATAAIVGRNPDNTINILATQSFNASSAFEAELRSLELGLKCCREKNGHRCMLRKSHKFRRVPTSKRMGQYDMYDFLLALSK